ncbi:AI-2E family transporter [Haladaptatus sp. W1]|uniref:AI-2E family transporter n=1 Tax=Haladaptatus sp. W1 TaxID=1897478 RepID=UPI0008499E68|nr:AI-2E family transporter [Haladaptatus sp. W1]ODR79444.1 AI-2E family transporter [Haladaptatus sp. W1]
MNRQRGFLLFLIAVFGVFSTLLVKPFLQYVLAAILLGYILHPVQTRFESRVSARVSALSLIGLTTLVVIVPVGAIAVIAAQQAFTLVRAIVQGDPRFAELIAFVERYTGVTIHGRTLQELLPAGSSSRLIENAVGIFGGLSDALIGLTVMVFILYYLLTDGKEFVAWIRRCTPLPDDVQDELYSEMDRVMWGVLVGNLLVGIVQGILTGIGFVIAGVPGVVFWTVVTTVLSLLPLIGASVVWLPASLYLFLVDRPIAAAFLFVYGTLVVSLSDNYLRPLVSGHEAKLNPGILVVGIFGGVYVFGFMGLFFGPIVLGIFRSLLTVFAREYAE